MFSTSFQTCKKLEKCVGNIWAHFRAFLNIFSKKIALGLNIESFKSSTKTLYSALQFMCATFVLQKREIDKG